MKKWQLIFDAERCNSCNNCVLATKDEYLLNRFEGYSEAAPRQGNLWLTLDRHERGSAPMIDVTHTIATCHQCVDAPCITAATRDAISQRDDGIVMIDPVKAQGRRDLVDACPFGHIHWNEAAQVAQKYTLDAHLLDQGWTQTRAVQACPTQALTMVKLDDAVMQQQAERDGLTPPPTAASVRPRVWFKNAQALTQSFLGGTLVHSSDGREDCVPGLLVKLIAADGTVWETHSDAFGDFKFDGLSGTGESYQIEVFSHHGEAFPVGTYTLNTSQWVGAIALPANP